MTFSAGERRGEGPLRRLAQEFLSGVLAGGLRGDRRLVSAMLEHRSTHLRQTSCWAGSRSNPPSAFISPGAWVGKLKDGRFENLPYGLAESLACTLIPASP